jgi:cytochrome c oxidase subunit 2
MDALRRNMCLSVTTAFGTLLLGGIPAAQGAVKHKAKERVIKIQARRFVYTPNEITIKKGEAVVLEFTSLDFVHGFNIPDLKIRADLPPGQVTRVSLKVDKSGVYDFLCDNFCGSGHEEMNGKIIVKD